MATKIILLLLVVATAAAVPHKSLKRPDHDNVNWYECTGRSVGNHIHPEDCSRYMTCSEGGIASDRACGACNQHNEQCLGKAYLQYNSSTDSCEWPATTPCVTGDDPNDPDDDVCEQEAGNECGEDDCDHCGYCKNKTSRYFRCERTFPSDPKLKITGVWVEETCDDNLWWNPDSKPNGMDEGGACDWWDNLSEKTQNRYKSDPDCVEQKFLCEWGQDPQDSCSGRYWYVDPPEDREDLSCGNDLIWDPKTETCRSCSNVAGCDCDSPPAAG